MKLRWLWVPLLIWGLYASPATADNRVIVRTTLGLQGLQAFCNVPLLPICTVVEGLDGTLNQLFLVTTPLDVTTFLNLLGSTVGIVDAEADQLLSLNSLNHVTTPPPGLSDTTPVNYYGSTVWDGYVNQPAAQIVGVSQAQSFHVTGTGIVADIDTGVDPNHPVLQPVLLISQSTGCSGYDFTRNQPCGSVMTDFTGTPPSSSTNVAQVNQSTAAVLDQSTAAVLDCNQQTPCQYAAFGHGTMVMGIIHLVAPQAQLLPLKAFSSDGTGDLSNILHAVYYGVQNGANVINMSFDMTSNSLEFSKAMDYANQNGVICVASAGNDGMEEIVYPAAYQNDVMGVASTSNTDTRSSFSNYGNAIVWVAAPGEAIISTYPFGTYAAGWGTSFSAPFVSGAAALLRSRQSNINEARTAAAVAAHAVLIGPEMGHGRLNLIRALQATSAGTSGDFDGDKKTDIAVFQPSKGGWSIIPSSNPSVPIQLQWGVQGDIPVQGDYDGDGKTDFAVFRPSTGQWFIIPSSNPSSVISPQWGTFGDIPVPGDYDGDGKTDFAVFRPSTGQWFIIPSSNPSSVISPQWGTFGDIPVPGDYDGDGKTDFAVFRPSTGQWFIIPSGNPGSPVVQQWGTQGDIPVPGDYDGDGKTDLAFFHPSTGEWFIIPSSNAGSPIIQQWGTAGDTPVPADYDGDQKTDLAVWRPSDGNWYIIPSSAPSTVTITRWGTNGDVPVQKPIGQ